MVLHPLAGRWQRAAGAFIALALALPAGSVPAAPAATTAIIVTTTTDEYNAGEACSLREAVVAANTDSAFGGCPAGSGADTIVLGAAWYTVTRFGYNEDAAATGDFDITSDLTIVGAGMTVTRIMPMAGDRVFEVHGAMEVCISDLALYTPETSGIKGGTINRGGDITFERVYVRRGGGYEAVLRNEGGTVSITDSLFREHYNTVVFENTQAGELWLDGSTIQWSYGSILNISGTLTVTNSLLSGSLVHEAILNYGAGEAYVSDSTFSGNYGGFYNEGQLVVEDSSIINSYLIPPNIGGAAVSNYGMATITNVTISGNGAAGLSNRGGQMALNNVTITGNGNPGLRVDGGMVTLANSIIFGNDLAEADTWDCAGTVNSLGYNLIGTLTGCDLQGGPGDLIGVDPGLGTLVWPEYAPAFHPLLYGSLAVDAGNPAVPGSGSPACAAADQRGMPRPQGAGCDIGAFEQGADWAWVFLPLVQR
jgi:CSLREA domain-containing protein